MVLSLARPALRSIVLTVTLAGIVHLSRGQEDISPLRAEVPPHKIAVDILPKIGASLAYSEEELATLYTQLEEKRIAQNLDNADTEREPDLETYTLRAFQVNRLDTAMLERLEIALQTDASKTLRKESKRDRHIRLEELYSERADQRFWSGEYDGTHNADKPQVGSVDLSKLLEGMSKLVQTKKKAEPPEG